MAKVLIVNSSFRKKSNSSALANQVGEGARGKGHDVSVIDVSRMNIKACMGCDSCLKPGADYCITKDDMYPLYPMIQAADVIIYSSPIYWFNLCGQLKQFIDRSYAVAVPPGHEGPSPFAGKSLGAVLVYGDDDPLGSGCINVIRSFQDICLYTGAQWLGAMHGSAYAQGDAAKNAALMQAAFDFGASF